MNTGLKLFIFFLIVIVFLSIFPLIGWLLNNFTWFLWASFIVLGILLTATLTILVYYMLFSDD